MADSLQANPESRMLFGNVEGPTAQGGEGYQVIHESTGIYTVTFNEMFASPPTVVVTQIHPQKLGEEEEKNAHPADNAVVMAVAEHRFKVLTGDRSGQKADRGFGFIAVGRTST